jgi:hypothetical protein
MLNYDARATYDGPCVPKTAGCTRPDAVNYWARANHDDGSCMVPGCTDPMAPNFSPNATYNNGECEHYVSGCTDPWAVNHRPLAIADDGSCLRVPAPPTPPSLPPHPPAEPCDGFELSIRRDTDRLFSLTVTPRVWAAGRRVVVAVLRGGSTLAFRKGPATLIAASDTELLLELLDAGDQVLHFNGTRPSGAAWPTEADLSVACAWAPPSPPPQHPSPPSPPPPPPSVPPHLHTLELYVLLSNYDSMVSMSQVLESTRAACEAEMAVLDFDVSLEQNATFTFARNGSWMDDELGARQAQVRDVSCAEALSAGGSCAVTLEEASSGRRLEEQPPKNVLLAGSSAIELEEQPPSNVLLAESSAFQLSAVLEHSSPLGQRAADAARTKSSWLETPERPSGHWRTTALRPSPSQEELPAGRRLSELSTAVILVRTAGLIPPSRLDNAQFTDLTDQQNGARVSMTLRVFGTPSFAAGASTLLLFAVRTALASAGLGDALDVDLVVVDRLVLPPAPPPSPPMAPAPPHGVQGCNDPAARNYESNVTIPDRSACRYLATARTGCMAPIATNYDAAAQREDGSCTFVYVGCKSPAAINYAPDATQDDLSQCLHVDATQVTGCLVPSALNYDSTATVDDRTCRFSKSGCTDPLSVNWAPDADADDGSCVARRSGCTAPHAVNYDSDANSDDGSCHNLSPPPPLGLPPPSPPAPPPSPSAPPPPPSPSPPPQCWWDLQLETCPGLSIDPAARDASQCARRCCGDPQCTVWQWTDGTVSAVAGVCARGAPGLCSTNTYAAADGGRRASAPAPPYSPNAAPLTLDAQRLAPPLTPITLGILIPLVVIALCLVCGAILVLCRRRSKVRANAAGPRHPTTRLKAGMVITGIERTSSPTPATAGRQAGRSPLLRALSSRAPLPLPPSVHPPLDLPSPTGFAHPDAAGQPSPLTASHLRRRSAARSAAELSPSAGSSLASSQTPSLQDSPRPTLPEPNLDAPRPFRPATPPVAPPPRSASAVRSEPPDGAPPLHVQDMDSSDDDEIFTLPPPLPLGSLERTATRERSLGSASNSTPRVAPMDQVAEEEASGGRAEGASAAPASRGKARKTKKGKEGRAPR